MLADKVRLKLTNFQKNVGHKSTLKLLIISRAKIILVTLKNRELKRLRFNPKRSPKSLAFVPKKILICGLLPATDALLPCVGSALQL